MLPTEEARLRRWPRHDCAPSGCAPTHAICRRPRNPHRPRFTKQRPSSPRFPPCEAFERRPPAARPTVVQGAGVRNPSAFETFEPASRIDVKRSFGPDGGRRVGETRRSCAMEPRSHAVSAINARALRTSLVVSPPSICARIGARSVQGSLREPASRHNRASSVGRRRSPLGMRLPPAPGSASAA